MKKGQISIFIILSVLILFSFFLVFKLRISFQSEMKDFSLNRAQIQNYLESRIKYTIDKSISATSFEGIDLYLDKHLVENINLNLFSTDYTIGNATTSVVMANDNSFMSVSVKLPIKINYGDTTISFSKFVLNYKLTEEVLFNIDENGILQSNSLIKSNDGRVKLEVPQGITALDSEGDPLEKVSVTIKDIDCVDSRGLFVFSTIDFQPDGARFSDFIELKVNYDPDLLPDDIVEQNIKMIQIKEDGSFDYLDSTIDTENHFIVAKINHFSEYTLGVSSDSVVNNILKCHFEGGNWIDEWCSFDNLTNIENFFSSGDAGNGVLSTIQNLSYDFPIAEDIQDLEYQEIFVDTNFSSLKIKFNVDDIGKSASVFYGFYDYGGNYIKLSQKEEVLDEIVDFGNRTIYFKGNETESYLIVYGYILDEDASGRFGGFRLTKLSSNVDSNHSNYENGTFGGLNNSFSSSWDKHGDPFIEVIS